MNSIIIKEKLKKLDEIISEWESLFDHPPEKFLDFGVAAVHGEWHLSLNGVVLGPVNEMLVDGMGFDPESFYIPCSDGSEIEILVAWPFKGQARLESILKYKTLYSG